VTESDPTGAGASFVVDPARSRVRVHTFAEGLLARLAHDLELVCTRLSGTAARAGASDAATTAGTTSLEAPLGGLEVAGVMKDGRLDERALSASDRRDILAKMLADVFHASASGVLRVDATLEGGAAKIRLLAPNGKSVEVMTRPELRPDGEGLRATGTFDVSLAKLGSDVLKGPMGAFRVKDRVAISFDVVFAPAAK
jgi:hypothetical protein